MVNCRKSRNRINKIMIEGRSLSEPNEIKDGIMKVFKEIFEEPMKKRPMMDGRGFRKLTDIQAKKLVGEFSRKEIKEAVWACGDDKSPGPDGLTFKFLKKHWEDLEQYVSNMVKQFHDQPNIPIGCNASFIALIPKVRDPSLVKHFRPISLIGMLYKIIAKLLARRVKPVIPGLVSNIQTGFIEGRSILEGPLIVNEVLAWAKSYKKQMFIFKVDFEKAYDSINWKFILSNLKAMNFPLLWRKWIGAGLKSGRASVLVNGSPTKEFGLSRGLRQGDPLSPFLFILALEALDVIMKRAIKCELFKGVVLPRDGPTISHLCYADDAIFLGEWSAENIKNLNRFLRCFYLCSGLKVNLGKCSLFGVGVKEEDTEAMAKCLGCKAGTTPFSFLGIQIGANMKRVKNWKVIVDKFNSKLSAWKARSLSMAGRIVLAKAVLGALPNYFFSIFLAPKKVIKELEAIRRDFVWGFKNGKNKMRWIAWEKIVKAKRYGGLGIGDIRSANLALLAKWWWKYKENPNALWVSVVNSIHWKRNSASIIPTKQKLSGTWKDICSIEKVFTELNLSLNKNLGVELGNGKKTRFWLDA
ncbi:putative RNA-directed DNA polymerase [Helianthus annuus]|nr:putative RNA-directed DNA polymerase [Helianthus annuus]